MAFEAKAEVLPGKTKQPYSFKNRSRLTTVADILATAKAGALKTHLMLKVNLSYAMLSEYVQFLEDNGLLSETRYPEEKATLYKTTEKGLRFLQSYTALRDLAYPTLENEMFRTKWNLK